MVLSPPCLSVSHILALFLVSFYAPFPVSGCLLASSLDTHVPDTGPGAPSPARDQMRVSHINFSEKGSPAAWRRDPTLVTAATRQSGDNKSPERTPPTPTAQESESRLSPQFSIPKPLGKQEVPEIPMVLLPPKLWASVCKCY